MCNCVVWAIRCGLAAMPILMAASCGRPTLVAEDAVVMAGRMTPLNADVGREGLFDLHCDARDATVVFDAGGRRIGEDRADESGRAFVVFDDQAGRPASFGARAKVYGRDLEGTGRIFHWRSDRVIVAVDVDYCIVQTNYVRLLFGNHIPVSPPFDGAREVLADLSKDYQILYLTARPRTMLNRTREWLDHYEFPAGPVVVSERFQDVLHQLEWKRDMLKELHVRYPTLLISVGNRQIDIQSALPNHMLPVIVQSVENDTKDDPGNVLLGDWKAIGEFFRVNREVLVDPVGLDKHIHEGVSLRQPVGEADGTYRYVVKNVNHGGEPNGEEDENIVDKGNGGNNG